MKGPAPTMRESSEVTEPEVKVKRKCGRPRNPIPRHRRVSHINAEQRRRSKIQTGLQRLKNLLPKDMPSGRDSKADVLTKSVDQTKYLQAMHKSRSELLTELSEEKRQLQADIKHLNDRLPAGKLFDDKPRTAQERFDNLVKERTQKNYKYFVFSYITKPLHDTFEAMVDGQTMRTFKDSVCSWANDYLSQQGLRPVITEALRNLSTETSVIDKPHQMAEEALQRCLQNTTQALPTSLIPTFPQPGPSSSSSSSSSSSFHPRQATGGRKHSRARASRQSKKGSCGSSSSRSSNSGSSRPPSSADSVSSACSLTPPDLFQPGPADPQGTPALLNLFYDAPLPSAVKTEPPPSCSGPYSAPPPSLAHVESPSAEPKMEMDSWASYISTAELASHHEADSPLSIDSAIELSPPRSSYDSPVFGELTGCESSLDQCYDHEGIIPGTGYPIGENFLQGGQHFPLSLPPVSGGGGGAGGSILGDLESFDIFDFIGDYREPNQPSSLLLSEQQQQQQQQQPVPGPADFDQNILEQLDMPGLTDPSWDLMDPEGSSSLLDVFGNCQQDDIQYNDSRFTSL